MRAFVNGKHGKLGPLYSLKELSCAAQLPIYGGEKEADVVFNWGGNYPYRPPTSARVLNERPLFGKMAQAKAMLGSGAPVPQAWGEITSIPVRAYPILLKPNDSHGGKGIRLLRDANAYRRLAAKLKRDCWFQQYIRKSRELRIYFWLGDIAMVSEKLVKDTSKVIWNIVNCTGWERRRELESNRQLVEITKKTAEAVRLDWGALDVLVDTSGKFWVCEINSRPSMWNRDRPKLKMEKDGNGIWQLTENKREDLTLSSRLWGNRMRRFLKEMAKEKGVKLPPVERPPVQGGIVEERMGARTAERPTRVRPSAMKEEAVDEKTLIRGLMRRVNIPKENLHDRTPKNTNVGRKPKVKPKATRSKARPRKKRQTQRRLRNR